MTTETPTTTPETPKAQKRPETRMRDAVILAEKLGPEDRAKALELLEKAASAMCAERAFALAKADAERNLAAARRVRDFAREVDSLNATQRAMVRAGVEAIGKSA